MVAHKMHTREVQLAQARRTPCDVKHARLLRRGQLLYLLETRGGLQAVRLRQLLVLQIYQLTAT